METREDNKEMMRIRRGIFPSLVKYFIKVPSSRCCKYFCRVKYLTKGVKTRFRIRILTKPPTASCVPMAETDESKS